jgi:hypothetical protein
MLQPIIQTTDSIGRRRTVKKARAHTLSLLASALRHIMVVRYLLWPSFHLKVQEP